MGFKSPMLTVVGRGTRWVKTSKKELELLEIKLIDLRG